jgi:hypothetical protein
MGYRTFIASKEPHKNQHYLTTKNRDFIESPFFKVQLDPQRGSIVSCIDKRSGKELVDAKAPQGFGQYFYERFSYTQLNDWLGVLYILNTRHINFPLCIRYAKGSDYSSFLPQNMELILFNQQ